jgi:hypothetical protein
LAAISASGCGVRETEQPAVDLTAYTPLSASEASEMKLVKVDSISLGSPNEGVFGITDFEVLGDDLYVADDMAKMVHVFDRSGRRLRTLGRPGAGPGEFKMPVSVTFSPRGVLVVDPSHGNRVSVFGFDGTFIESRAFDTPTPPVAITMTGNRMVSMGVLGITDPGRQGWNVLGITDAEGKRVGQGCMMDARYLESSKREGMLSHIDFGGVSSRDNRIYCTQSISPVVQVMDSLGRPIEQIRIAPPFYVAPRDKEETLNQKAIFDYLGSFTAHVAFYPVEGGFVSVYSRFDPKLGEVRYHLFACETGEKRECGVVRNIRKPVYIPSLRTVYVEEESQPNQPVRVGVYQMSGFGVG